MASATESFFAIEVLCNLKLAPIVRDSPCTTVAVTAEVPEVKKTTRRRKDKSQRPTKCHNRECTNLRGQDGKPRSIYCSPRCQSREQNLRQGRIKNVRKTSSRGAKVCVEGLAGPLSGIVKHSSHHKDLIKPTLDIGVSASDSSVGSLSDCDMDRSPDYESGCDVYSSGNDSSAFDSEAYDGCSSSDESCGEESLEILQSSHNKGSLDFVTAAAAAAASQSCGVAAASAQGVSSVLPMIRSSAMAEQKTSSLGHLLYPAPVLPKILYSPAGPTPHRQFLLPRVRT